MKLIFRTAALLILSCSFSSAAETAAKQNDYKGAAALLKQIEEQSKESAPAEKPSEAKKLQQDVKEFATNNAALTPLKAATEWLALLDRFLALQVQERFADGSETPLQQNDLLDALPGPAAWNDLRKLVDNRPKQQGSRAASEVALRLLAHTLTGDRSAQTNDVAAIGSLAKTGRNKYLWQNVAQQLNQAALEMSDDPAAVITALEQQLNGAAKSRTPRPLRLPDLVSIAGEEAATTFLRRALRTPNVQISIEEGDEMRSLARRVALELIAELKLPQWQLASSLDGIELFEAMDKKFRDKEQPKLENDPIPSTASPIQLLEATEAADTDYSRQHAEAYYMLGLITRNRAQDAAKVALRLAEQPNVSLPPDAFQSLERSGYSRALNRFFRDLLTEKPELPFWENYFDSAVKAGDSERMVSIARSAAARQDLSESKKAGIHAQLYRALLAADKIDEGIDELRKVLRQPNPRSRSA